jgi:hypothetical protein
MFPALVRYDECVRGMVEHAMRIVVRRTRLGPIYPATHNASVGNLTDPNIPAMGQRVRLKESFVIPENWTIFEKAVLRGLKKYGAMVADNGNFFSISVTPDDRYPAGAFSHLSSIAITNFEVVQTTGASEGPRSPGAPVAEAGVDLSAAPGTAISLSGSVQTSAGTGSIVTEWKVYSGPGSAQFSDAARTNTTMTFEATGDYVLMLKATDGIHAPSYDTVRVQVTDAFAVSARREGSSVRLEWPDLGGSYAVESTDDLSKSWGLSVTVPGTEFVVPEPNGQRFFRVRREN